MSTKPFVYQDPFPLAHDDTEYYLLSKEHVSVAEFDGQQVLKVEPQALTLLAQQAFHDAAFMLRVSHQQQVASILLDPEASDNDKYVALQFLRNSEIAAKGVLPTCQDTGTAIIMGKKGQRVWTGGGDEAALAHGVYNTYTEDNLRYSQNAALDMYKEVNTGTNLPSVATPNGQAAFLFLLTSALAPLIRLSYGRMVWMALPYTLVLTIVGLLCVKITLIPCTQWLIQAGILAAQ